MSALDGVSEPSPVADVSDCDRTFSFWKEAQHSEHGSLADGLLRYGPPEPEEDLLSDTREQLAALQALAAWAKAECPQCSHLVEALHGHIQQELALTCVLDPAMRPRLQELNASAKESLATLQSVLEAAKS